MSASHAISASQGIPGHVRKSLGAAAALLVVPTLLAGAAARNGAKFKGDCIATRTPSEAFSTKTIECPRSTRVSKPLDSAAFRAKYDDMRISGNANE